MLPGDSHPITAHGGYSHSPSPLVTSGGQTAPLLLYLLDPDSRGYLALPVSSPGGEPTWVPKAPLNAHRTPAAPARRARFHSACVRLLRVLAAPAQVLAAHVRRLLPWRRRRLGWAGSGRRSSLLQRPQPAPRGGSGLGLFLWVVDPLLYDSVRSLVFLPKHHEPPHPGAFHASPCLSFLFYNVDVTCYSLHSSAPYV